LSRVEIGNPFEALVVEKGLADPAGLRGLDAQRRECNITCRGLNRITTYRGGNTLIDGLS
jgi:hypothetical protein